MFSLTGVAGCSGSPDWRMGGLKLEKLDETLEAATAAWRSSVSTGDVKVTVPEDAGCYYQVVQDRDVTDELLCGPVRYLGDDATTWQSAKITLTPTDADIGYISLDLSKSGEPRFKKGAKTNPNATAVRSDGGSADLTVKVDEPAAPAAAVGDIVTNVAGSDTTSARLKTPAGDHALDVTVARSRVGDASTRRMPPTGGSFVVTALSSPAMGSMSSLGSDDREELVVSAGGHEYILDASSPSGTTAVAIAGDGKDAKVGIRFDGLTQWVEASTGKRVGTAAAGYYDGLADSADTTCPDKTSGTNDGPGWYRSFGCTVEVTRVPYLAADTENARKTTGWAKDGMVYVMTTVTPSYRSSWRAKDSFYSTSYDKAIDLKVNLVAGGQTYKPIEQVEADGSIFASDKIVLVFEIPAGEASLVLKGAAAVSDTLGASLNDEAPKKGSDSFPMDLGVTIPKAS